MQSGCPSREALRCVVLPDCNRLFSIAPDDCTGRRTHSRLWVFLQVHGRSSAATCSPARPPSPSPCRLLRYYPAQPRTCVRACLHVQRALRVPLLRSRYSVACSCACVLSCWACAQALGILADGSSFHVRVRTSISSTVIATSAGTLQSDYSAGTLSSCLLRLLPKGGGGCSG